MKPLRILLVDDHEMVREALSAVLEGEPTIEVVAQASTCAGALAALAEHQPDVLILDYNLSDGSALTVIPDARAKFPATRILVLTVHDNPHYAARCVQAGAHGFLAKSGPVTELVDAVRRVHTGEVLIPGRFSEAVMEAVRGQARGIDGLSAREFELLRLLGSGATLTQAAAQQNISTSTASTYRARLMEKLQLRTTAEIIRYALEHGMTSD